MRRARTDVSKENRRNFILTCAEEIIIEEGLSKLSLQRVAKKSDLAIGTIYLYFEKKEDLIAHLTLKSRFFLLRQFEESTREETNPIQQIAKLLEAYFQFYKSYPHYNELVSFFETNAGLDETQELVESSMQINQLVINILQQGKREGLFRDDLNEMTFSFLLWGATVGIIQLIEVKKKRLELTLGMQERDFYAEHISMIINSIKKKN